MKMKLNISLCVVLFLLTACKPSAPLVPVGEACIEQNVGKRITVEGYLLIQRCLGEDVVWCDMYVEDISGGLLKAQYSSDPDVVLNPLAAPPLGDGWISSQVCGDDEDCYTGRGNTQFHLEGSCILNQQILLVTDLDDIKPIEATANIPTPTIVADWNLRDFAYGPTPTGGKLGGIDGVFVHEDPPSESCPRSYIILRFYEDGQVIHTNLCLEQDILKEWPTIRQWFRRDRSPSLMSAYYTQGSTIWFRLCLGCDYYGETYNDTLILEEDQEKLEFTRLDVDE
jgi:hypothetical protein